MEYTVNDTELTSTANAIRSKSGTVEEIEWKRGEGFATAIASGCQADLDLLVTRNLTAYHSNVDRVSNSAFRGCANLVDVQLPECLYIRQLAFRGCTKLTELVLPKCVSIQTEVFASSGITRLVLLSNTLCVLDNVNALSGTPISRGAGSIEVPAALVETYKADPVWSSFASLIVAYSDEE